MSVATFGEHPKIDRNWFSPCCWDVCRPPFTFPTMLNPTRSMDRHVTIQDGISGGVMRDHAIAKVRKWVRSRYNPCNYTHLLIVCAIDSPSESELLSINPFYGMDCHTIQNQGFIFSVAFPTQKIKDKRCSISVELCKPSTRWCRQCLQFHVFEGYPISKTDQKNDTSTLINWPSRRIAIQTHKFY